MESLKALFLTATHDVFYDLSHHLYPNVDGQFVDDGSLAFCGSWLR